MASDRVFSYRQIGVIRTGHSEPDATPIQPVFAEGACGRVVLLPEYEEGLCDLERFSHVYLIYAFDRAGQPRLRVRPYLDDTLRGVFATRAPSRPNAIGLSLVRLLGRDGATLRVADVDILDGTPLLDIKPYIGRFDSRDEARSGWQEDIDDETARRLGSREVSRGDPVPRERPGREEE